MYMFVILMSVCGQSRISYEHILFINVHVMWRILFPLVVRLTAGLSLNHQSVCSFFNYSVNVSHVLFLSLTTRLCSVEKSLGNWGFKFIQIKRCLSTRGDIPKVVKIQCIHLNNCFSTKKTESIKSGRHSVRCWPDTFPSDISRTIPMHVIDCLPL